MFVLVYLLFYLKTVNAGSHSLMIFGTYIVGQTPFPEFSAVVMLDDLQIAYYDSNTWKPVPRTQRDSKYYDEEERDARIVFSDMHNDIKDRAIYIKEHLNHTDGVHVYQRIAGCELLNDKTGLLHFWDALDGQNVEEYTFDIQKGYIQMEMPWIIKWDLLIWQPIYKTLYYPICIKTLQRYLFVEKNNMMRKVKPRVRLLKKKLWDSERLQISCLATGFYPRHINLTLFRDAQPVDDDQMTGGEILPNGDGTYQMRKSWMISEKELCEGHHYNCTMKHLNLDNKLDIMSACDPGSSSLSVVISVLVIVSVFILITTALIIWMQKRLVADLDVKTSLEIDYSQTPTSD